MTASVACEPDHGCNGCLWLPEVSRTSEGIDELEEWLVKARLEGVLVQSEEILATNRQLGDQAFSRFAASLLSASVEFARAGADAVHTGIRIQYIDLSGNCLTDTAAAALSECLAWIREHFGGHVLRSLRLSRNEIGPSAAEEVALKFFPLDRPVPGEPGNEYHLDLSENPLGDRGVSLLAMAVQRRDCNAVLQLRDVGCGVEGCRSLMQCFRTLKGLDLSKNDIPEIDANALAAKLPRSSRFSLPGVCQSGATTVAIDTDTKASASVSRAQAILERARLASGKEKPLGSAPGDWRPAHLANALQAPAVSSARPSVTLRASTNAQAVLDRARHVLASKIVRHGAEPTLEPVQEEVVSVAPGDSVIVASPSPSATERLVLPQEPALLGQQAAMPKLPELLSGGASAASAASAASVSESSSCKSPSLHTLGEVVHLQQALGHLAGGLGLPPRVSHPVNLVSAPDSEASEPDAEALAMPERTVRLEREVAELREDVRRIEHTVSSLHVEPEQEDGIDGREWRKMKTDGELPENGSLILEDMCSVPSIASLKAEKDMRELDVPKSPVKTPSKGKGKGVKGAKGPPLPAKALPKKSSEVLENAGLEVVPGEPPPGPSAPPSPPKGKGKAKGSKGGKGGKGGPPPPPPKNPPPKAPGTLKSEAKAESKAPFHKKLYWKQVDIADAEGTIFSEVSRNRSQTCSAIDFNALSKMLEAEKTKGSQLQRRSSGVLSKAQMRNVGTKVLSDHRARNIAIVLKRMPTSTVDLVEVLRRLHWEDDRISSDDLEQILEAIPTPDEAKKLREHSGAEDCQKLRDVEQMVMPLSLLSRATARVRVLCIARNARLQFKSTMRSLARIRAACLAIQESGMLRNVMLLALQLGNFINHGDSKKGAKAIAISSLLALRDFKMSEGISTLHFLCASLMRSDANVNAAQVLLRELQPAERIAKMQVQSLSAAMKSFTRDLDTIKSECQNFLAEYEGGTDTGRESLEDEEDAKEFRQELAEVQAAAAAAACDMLDSPLKTQREDEDATRWVEDVMKIRGSAQRRLRCMRHILEKLCHLLKADMDSTAEQVHATLRFCGVMLPRTSSTEVPTDLEALLSNLSEFTKVFKEHWDEVKKNMSHYQRLFSDSASSSSSSSSSS